MLLAGGEAAGGQSQPAVSRTDLLGVGTVFCCSIGSDRLREKPPPAGPFSLQAPGGPGDICASVHCLGYPLERDSEGHERGSGHPVCQKGLEPACLLGLSGGAMGSWHISCTVVCWGSPNPPRVSSLTALGIPAHHSVAERAVPALEGTGRRAGVSRHLGVQAICSSHAGAGRGLGRWEHHPQWQEVSFVWHLYAAACWGSWFSRSPIGSPARQVGLWQAVIGVQLYQTHPERGTAGLSKGSKDLASHILCLLGFSHPALTRPLSAASLLGPHPSLPGTGFQEGWAYP